MIRTTDAGLHWERKSRGLWDTAVSAVWVHPDDPTGAHVFAGTHSGVYESVDAAETWARCEETKGWGNVRSFRQGVIGGVDYILAGTDAQASAIIDSGLMPVLVRLMGNESSSRSVKQQAAWCVINAADAVMPSQVVQFANAGAIKALCDLLMDSNIIPSPVAPLQALLRLCRDDVGCATVKPLVDLYKLRQLQAPHALV